jgi:hypothetical protein
VAAAGADPVVAAGSAVGVSDESQAARVTSNRAHRSGTITLMLDSRFGYIAMPPITFGLQFRAVRQVYSLIAGRRRPKAATYFQRATCWSALYPYVLLLVVLS